MRLAGKTSLITGGGRGLGRAIALRFAAEGSNVVVSGTTEAAIEAAANEIRENGGRAIAVRADVADELAVKDLVAATLTEFGRIDVLVNNAGIIGPTAAVVQIEREDWDRTIAVNLTGAFLCAKHALPHMIEQRSGRVLNITSVAGLIGYNLRSAYAVSKWGMIGFTRTLAIEAGRYDITVNAIAPGPVKGPRMDAVIRLRAESMGKSISEVEEEYLQPIALKRMVDEGDIAATALFLASDDGRNITGETITVSGGYPL
ncbi:MAG: hypothetical protein DMF61_03465 [Blastocatellia bacterium AA13]|nr:MAG: hypothetical protein DMF61_03465 [Blastocatellia bacterium AA13]